MQVNIEMPQAISVRDHREFFPIRHLTATVSLGVCTLFGVQVQSAGETPAIRAEGLRPSGQRYEATVPDTLDLAERARLSVHGLTSFLNPEADYAPYGHAYFNANPPYLSDMPGGPPNWGKIAEALIMARLMCGSEENLQVDAKMLEGMLGSPWMKVNPVAPTPVSCGMQALMAVYQLDPHPALKQEIDAMAEAHFRAAKSADEAAYYYDGPYDERETALGVTGYWLPVFIQRRAIRALTRWSALGGNTLVAISPRDQGPGYPLYLRDHLKAQCAPTKKVTRYVPPVLVKW